jgi:exonuclease VII small subunit
MSGADIFRANLQHLVDSTGQTARQTAIGAGIPNQTLNEWLTKGRTTVKGKGREHLENLRNHFNKTLSRNLFIKSTNDFWRADLLDGFSVGTQLAEPPPSVVVEKDTPAEPTLQPERGSSDGTEPCIESLGKAVQQLCAARRQLEDCSLDMAVPLVEEGLHLISVCLQHLDAMQIKLKDLDSQHQKRLSEADLMFEKEMLMCKICGNMMDFNNRSCCQTCESEFCPRCRIGDECVECLRAGNAENDPTVINRSKDLSDRVQGMTSEERKTLRDRVRQRTTQKKYWGR